MPDKDFAAGFVIFRLDEQGVRNYLVIKNAAGHWEFSKGHAKAGETWIQTARRELEEETGINDVQPIPDFARKIEYVFRERHRAIVRKTVVFFLGQTGVTKIRISDEHLEFKFLSFKSALRRLTHAGTRAVLRDVETFLNAHGFNDKLKGPSSID